MREAISTPRDLDPRRSSGNITIEDAGGAGVEASRRRQPAKGRYGMRAEASRIFGMGARVDRFNDAHPDTDQGNSRSAAEVKRLVEQMQVVAMAQRTGLQDESAGAAEKARVRRAILAGPVAHLAEVGKRSNQGGLAASFRYRPGSQTYLAFRTALRTMQSAAEEHKEVLMRHGLSEAVLAQLQGLLDQFDEAARRTDDGRIRHKSATAELEALAQEIQSVVRTMDARNRQRFEADGQLLESWISASTVLGNRRPETGGADEGPADQAGPVNGGPANAGPVKAAPAAGGRETPVAGGEARPAA
jgi:hypothetical protein